MYNYNIQYVDFRWDEKEEMGQIDAVGAVNAFRTFPFPEQYQKAKTLPEPTAPTLSFVSQGDGAILSVWSHEPNEYELYLENAGEKITVETKGESLIVESINSFFAGSRKDLFNRLASEPSAVTKRGFFNTIRSFFSG
ncbi:MAG: hypothetical protein IPN69_18615 [Acidobacteria bacterium]|nr:hypothetical protein [Acidobacteriota bacterium]